MTSIAHEMARNRARDKFIAAFDRFLADPTPIGASALAAVWRTYGELAFGTNDTSDLLAFGFDMRSVCFKHLGARL